MDDIKRALLGDHEAAKRLTDAGVMVPCQHGSKAVMLNTGNVCPTIYYRIIAKDSCCMQARLFETEHEARLTWNTRAPILSAEEMEMLHGKENP